MPSQSPVPIDRATFDRVLQRAAELQAAAHERGEGLTEDEIVALGLEVGIPAQHLRQALLEERTRPRPPVPAGAVDRWFGRAEVSAERVVQGTEDDIAVAAAKWLEYHEHFVEQRASSGRVTFEPMSSIAGAMHRIGAVFDGKRARPYLDKAELVTALITPLEPGFCHVTLIATLRQSRRRRLQAGAGLAAFGALPLAAMIVAGSGAVFAVVPLAALAVAGWMVARGFRHVARRTTLGLERALDELERRPALPAGVPRAVPGSTVGQLVRELMREVHKAFDE